MVGVARIELATPAMSTQLAHVKVAEIRHFSDVPTTEPLTNMTRTLLIFTQVSPKSKFAPPSSERRTFNQAGPGLAFQSRFALRPLPTFEDMAYLNPAPLPVEHW